MRHLSSGCVSTLGPAFLRRNGPDKTMAGVAPGQSGEGMMRSDQIGGVRVAEPLILQSLPPEVVGSVALLKVTTPVVEL